jgi:hypothetical protein
VTFARTVATVAATTPTPSTPDSPASAGDPLRAVTGREQTARTAPPTDRIRTGATTPVPRLITCGGAFDRAASDYLDNVIGHADQLV